MTRLQQQRPAISSPQSAKLKTASVLVNPLPADQLPIVKRTVLILGLAACAPKNQRVEPIHLTESHCWWAVLRTDRSPDSVTKTFRRAYEKLGFRKSKMFSIADTSWTESGPTPLSDVAKGTIYQSRMVAYNHGDSTHFRFFVEYPPQPDSVVHSESADHPGPISMCGRVAGATGFRWSVLKNPDGEEKLSVWRKR